MVKIIVDSREPIEIVNTLEEFGCEVDVRMLDVGDYLLSSKTIVERKRGDDFAASLFDGRLFEQIRVMLNTYERVIMVIDDYELMFENYSEYAKHFYGAMAKICTIGIPIIPVPNTECLARFLIAFAIKEQKNQHIPLFERANPIGWSLRDKQLFLIEGLLDTGIVKAERMLDEFGSPINVFNAIADAIPEYTRNGNIKKYPSIPVHGIGKKYIEQNKELLSWEE